MCNLKIYFRSSFVTIYIQSCGLSIDNGFTNDIYSHVELFDKSTCKHWKHVILPIPVWLPVPFNVNRSLLEISGDCKGFARGVIAQVQDFLSINESNNVIKMKEIISTFLQKIFVPILPTIYYHLQWFNHQIFLC